MRLDLREILQEQGKSELFERTIADPSLVMPDLPPGFRSPLHIRAEAQNTGSSILVRVKMRTAVELPCSRCLTPIMEPIAADYVEEFVAAADQQGPLLDEGDVRVSLYQDKEIDLTAGVRENLLLALPGRPLCRPDCPGLCPRCGHNLNEGPCRCEPEEMLDPRLAKLAQLLEREKDS